MKHKARTIYVLCWLANAVICSRCPSEGRRVQHPSLAK